MTTHVRVVIGDELTQPDPNSRPMLFVDLPDGYRRVFSGAVKPGDEFLHAGMAQKGQCHWLPVTDMGGTADDYMLLVRNDNSPVEKECERCLAYVRSVSNRFCEECCRIVVRSARSA